MSKVTVIEDQNGLAPAMAARVARVRQLHGGFTNAFERQMVYAYLCGLELNAIKESLHHGEFMAFREKHLPEVSKSAAGRYMDFVNLLVSKFPTMGNLKPAGLELTEPETRQVMKAVHEAADGKTFTAFYRDLKLIREKQHPKYTPPKRTAKEKFEDQKRQAEQIARSTMGSMAMIDAKLLSLLDDTLKRELLDAGIEFNNRIRKLTKGGKH